MTSGVSGASVVLKDREKDEKGAKIDEPDEHGKMIAGTREVKAEAMSVYVGDDASSCGPDVSR